MPFEWPTAEQALYRVMRLRRLIAVAIIAPVLVALLVSHLNPAALSAQSATWVAFGIFVLMTGHAVLFPNVTLETLALSISSATLIAVMPLIKLVAGWAPAEHQTAALVLLTAFGVVATGVLMALVQIALSIAAQAGPLVGWRIRTQADLPCSADVARRMCALVPDTRRGRILTGPEDENGFFEVAIAAAQHSDPAAPERPLVVKVDAKVMCTTAVRHDVMLVLRNGHVTVTSQEFAATDEGCRITVTDLPGDFTVGMHAIYWLTDQQADNLAEMTDVISGKEGRANGLAHGVSLLSIAGAVISPKTPVGNRAG